MSERKNIDKLFQEQFKDFEVNPPEHTWQELERRLKKKKNRKIVPFWWRLGGVAAALVVGLTVGNQMGWFGGQSSTQDQNQVVLQDPASSDPGNSSNTSNSSEGIAAKDSVAGLDQNSSDAAPLVQSESAQTNKNTQPPAGDRTAITDAEAQKKAGKRSGQRSANRIIPEARTAVAGHEGSRLNRQSDKSAPDGKAKRQSVAQSDGETSGQNKSDDLQKQLSEKRDAVAQNNRIINTRPGNAKQDILPPNNGVAQTDTNPSGQSTNNSAKSGFNPTGIAQNTLDAKSSEAATTRGTNPLAEGNQKADPNQKHTTNVINQVAAAEEHQKKLDSTAIATVPNALEELLNEKENKVTKEPKLNRWQITSNVAPIYFGSTSGGSPIDSTFSGNPKQYDTQVSYGIGASYAISKRLSVRTGINKVALSYDTNDVELYASIDNGGLKNVDMPAGNETLNFARNTATARGSEANRMQSAMVTGELVTDKFSGTINQKMGYIEVPVELSYALIDKKFGVNVIAGVSTLFLSDNQIVLTSEGMRTDLGKANNLNQTHFSSNVGLGVKYRFLKSFEANFEPIFKYQINTFSKDSGDFKPYFFGLYTGISFRF